MTDNRRIPLWVHLSLPPLQVLVIVAAEIRGVTLGIQIAAIVLLAFSSYVSWPEWKRWLGR